jgi:DNA-binding helix-hairpin-helix protein with protein kinase domain
LSLASRTTAGQQLDQYLENFFIEHAMIPGIGPSRKATLESYGIETASDVDTQRIVAVPGFGRAMADKLMEWRRELKRSRLVATEHEPVHATSE